MHRGLCDIYILLKTRHRVGCVVQLAPAVGIHNDIVVVNAVQQLQNNVWFPYPVSPPTFIVGDEVSVGFPEVLVRDECLFIPCVDVMKQGDCTRFGRDFREGMFEFITGSEREKMHDGLRFSGG